MIRVLSSDYVKNVNQYIANIDRQPIAVVDGNGNVLMTIGGLSDPTEPPTYFNNKGKEMLHLLTGLERQLLENQLSQEWFRDYISGKIRDYAYRDVSHAVTILNDLLKEILIDLNVEIASFLKEEIIQNTLETLGLSSATLTPVKKVTILIEDQVTSGTESKADVAIKVQGEWIEKIAETGLDSWTNIKGAIHSIIAEMDLGPGKQVTISTESK